MKTTFALKSLIAAFFIALAFGSGDSKKETKNTKGNNYNQFTNADFSRLINTSGRNSVLNFKETFEYSSFKTPAGFVSKSGETYTVKLDVYSNGGFTYKINQRQALRGKWNIVQSSNISSGCINKDKPKCILNLKFENGSERNPILYYNKKKCFSGLLDCGDSQRRGYNVSDWDDINRGVLVIPYDKFD